MDDNAWSNLPVTLTSTDLQSLLNVGPATVSKWLKAGKIPSHQIGSTWITFRCEVAAWLESTANTPATGRRQDPHPLDSYGPLLTKNYLATLLRKRLAPHQRLAEGRNYPCVPSR